MCCVDSCYGATPGRREGGREGEEREREGGREERVRGREGGRIHRCSLYTPGV